MPAYNFLSQFAPDVESGQKRQTIRRKRKRPTRAGDALYLYTGMRTKACRKLGEATCRSVTDIAISMDDSIMLGGEKLNIYEEIRLAQADGFNGLTEFYEFFKARYGLPFEGVLIEW